MSDLRRALYDDWDARKPEHVPEHQPASTGANSRQEGGSHYKAHQYETWDVILDWNLGYLDGNAVKYLSRWRLKNGIEDLKKARHYIDKLIEVEQKRGG